MTANFIDEIIENKSNHLDIRLFNKHIYTFLNLEKSNCYPRIKTGQCQFKDLIEQDTEDYFPEDKYNQTVKAGFCWMLKGNTLLIACTKASGKPTPETHKTTILCTTLSGNWECGFLTSKKCDGANMLKYIEADADSSRMIEFITLSCASETWKIR